MGGAVRVGGDLLAAKCVFESAAGAVKRAEAAGAAAGFVVAVVGTDQEPVDYEREKHGDEDDGEYPENRVVHGGEDGCAHASPARCGVGGVVFCA